ncbi:MAG: hypothetical protein AAB583_04545 [Patescibacteria group bacterium]
MSKNIVRFGIAVLVVIAVVLGYQIYQQTTVYQTPPIQNGTVPQTVGNQQASTQKGLTAEEKQALSFPGPNATEEEKKKHSDLVDELGNRVAGTLFLDITGCKPNPIVYRVKQGGSFKVKNSDSIDHTLSTDRKITIKANSEQTLTSKSIGDVLGNYGYGCAEISGGTVGIIQIIP